MPRFTHTNTRVFNCELCGVQVTTTQPSTKRCQQCASLSKSSTRKTKPQYKVIRVAVADDVALVGLVNERDAFRTVAGVVLVRVHEIVPGRFEEYEYKHVSDDYEVSFKKIFVTYDVGLMRWIECDDPRTPAKQPGDDNTRYGVKIVTIPPKFVVSAGGK